MTLLSYLRGKKESTFLSELRPAETISLALTAPPRWFPQDQHCRTLLSLAAIPTRASCWFESCPQREAATATRDQRWRCSTGEAPSAAERSRPSSSDPVNSHTFQTVALGRNFLSKQRSWSRMFLKCLPLPGGAVWSVPSKSVFTWGLHFHNHTFFFFALFPTASV